MAPPPLPLIMGVAASIGISVELNNTYRYPALGSNTTQGLIFAFSLYSFFSLSIEEINKEKHALNDTNDSLSRDLTKYDAEKFVSLF
jgi:hypothetical protein